ncbi:hypothetical protein HK104_002311 [Borealophlyctis nickersoniae]|nr:hypothetical protein HK104_002311 [Borealophlyctis nickersoniae]
MGPRGLPVHIPKKGGKPVGVIVTGASSGIGRELAMELVGKGYVVFAGVRKREDGVEVKREAEGLMMTGAKNGVGVVQKMKAEKGGKEGVDGEVVDGPGAVMRRSVNGGELVPVLLDVTSDEAVSEAYKTVAAYLGQIDGVLAGVVNVAGVLTMAPMELATPQILQDEFAVNFFGPLRLVQTFLPLLRQSKGRIINVGSLAGYVVAPGVGPYCSSKAAIAAATDAMRQELRKFGIGVSLVEPGAMRTRAWDRGIASLSTFNSTGHPGSGIDTTGAILPPAEGAQGSSTSKAVTTATPYARLLTSLETTYTLARAVSFPPKHVTQQIQHALRSRWPRARYHAGWDAKVAAVVPRAVTEWAMKWVLWW